MAARVFAGRYQVKPTVLHAFECAFRYSGFRRIAFIVGRIDRQERGLNPFEAGRGVVVARRLPLVKKVIGIAGERGRQALVEELVGLLARGGQLLVRERASAGSDAEEHAGQAQGRRLSRVVAVVPFGIVSSIMRRNIQLRLAMGVGCDAIGTSTSIRPGYFSPQSQVCMPPMELPSTRRR